MVYKKIKKIDVEGMDMLMSIDNPTQMITVPQYLIKGYIEQKNLEARLIELDLLEQAINQEQDIRSFKMRRLSSLKSKLIGNKL